MTRALLGNPIRKTDRTSTKGEVSLDHRRSINLNNQADAVRNERSEAANSTGTGDRKPVLIDISMNLDPVDRDAEASRFAP